MVPCEVGGFVRGFHVLGIAIAAAAAIAIAAFGSLDLTVRDPSGSADDVAHVILIYPDASQQDLGFTPQGNESGRTWNLLTESQILSKGPGTYTLRIIHDKDTNAVCSDPDDEVLGTYEITFGGGIVVSGVDDAATASGGQPTMIDVLSNDLLVDASSFTFGTMPCPISVPDTDCACSTYGSPAVQCPSILTLGINYVQGQFEITVGDPSLSIVSPGSPAHGEVSVIGEGIQYTPDDGYCGMDSFVYSVSRGGSTDTATVNINVSSASPTPQDDQIETPEAQAVLIDVLANDGGGLELIAVSLPVHGQAAVVGNQVRYTPQARFEGADEFSYTVRNACSETATANVDVNVLHVNHPPVANVGSLYNGVVGEPVQYDARFSSDPDLEDTLEYRWDVDGDGQFDTGWLPSEIYEVVYDAPFFGRVAVEVRDIYRNQPTGDTATASALARIEPMPPKIEAVLFLDLDGDGEQDENECICMAEIPLILDDRMTLLTDEMGQASFAGLSSGEHAVRITDAGLDILRQRGYGVEEFALVIDVRPGEPTTVLFASQFIVGRIAGVVFLDENGSGAKDDGESGVADLLITLDEGEIRHTNEAGQFLFQKAPVGERTLVLRGETHEQTEAVIVLGGQQITIEIPWQAPKAGFLEIRIEQAKSEEP